MSQPQKAPISDIASDDLLEAQRVLKIEAGAILTLAQSLDDNFEKVVDLMANLKGRIILSGIGKSGHIANKIASTLSSTGTPSFFIHPSEASHGDLGMLTKEDILMVLSNSGETMELLDLLSYAKRFNISLVAITSQLKSTLASAANFVLLLPPYAEACPMGLAPTTSTTLMLALGDALALTLLGRKKFSMSDFKNLHPGGKLGRKLLQVCDLMRAVHEIPLTPLGTLMSEALVTMTEKGFGCIGVVDHNNKLKGVITDGDLRRHMSPNLLSERVEDVMTTSPKTIDKNKLAAEALRIMNEKGITNLFVIDETTKALVGLLRMHDCLREGIA